MEPPLEPPAVQEGPSDPPKLTFGAQMESRGPMGTQKACQNDPQGTPETQKYPKKLPKNNQKGSHKYIQIVFVQQREKHLQQTKKRTAETVQIIKTIKTLRKPIKIIQQKYQSRQHTYTKRPKQIQETA